MLVSSKYLQENWLSETKIMLPCNSTLHVHVWYVTINFQIRLTGQKHRSLTLTNKWSIGRHVWMLGETTAGTVVTIRLFWSRM